MHAVQITANYKPHKLF